jgi:hypothetical protein
MGMTNNQRFLYFSSPGKLTGSLYFLINRLS